LACTVVAAETPSPISPTVRSGGLDIRLADLVLTPKGKDLYVLWDAFPYREALAKLDGTDPLAKVAAGLARNFALRKYPKGHGVRVTVVEFTERDSYGTPRYDTAKTLGSYDMAVDPKNGRLQLPPRKVVP
jgi:hypothetical protein